MYKIIILMPARRSDYLKFLEFKHKTCYSRVYFSTKRGLLVCRFNIQQKRYFPINSGLFKMKSPYLLISIISKGN